jgi:hypothetical protein
VHDLNIEALAEDFSGLLGLESEMRSLPDAGAGWQIGWYVPVAGQRFAVVLILPVSEEQAHHDAVYLRAYYDRPFLLLAPTRAVIEPVSLELLRAGRSRVLYLEEMLGIGATAEWQLLRPAEDLLRDFRHDLLGDVRFGMPEHRFPTPPGTTWNDVALRFINGHELESRVSGRGGGVFSYAHLGMAKTNKDEPTVQWDLLRSLAESRGEFLWPRSVRRKTMQKRRQRLADHLRDFLGIMDNPFDDLLGRRGFKTRFTIVPER